MQPHFVQKVVMPDHLQEFQEVTKRTRRVEQTAAPIIVNNSFDDFEVMDE